MALTKESPPASAGPAEPSADAGSRRPRLFPGHPTVWRAAAVVGLILGALVVWQVGLVERDHITGTNSTFGRSPVGLLAPGQELCVRGLDLPAGTGRVRFDVQPEASAARLSARLRSSGRSTSGAAALPAGSRRHVDVPVDPLPVTGPTAPASLCVVATGGPVTFFGVWELRSGDLSPTIDGEETGHPVALWYLAPAGETRTWLQSFGDIVERAALFRPGFVGAWTYVLLVVVLLPGLAYAAIRLLAMAAAGRKTRLPVAVVVGLLACGNAVAWSMITPAFDAPDEFEHFAYAQYLAETGNAPCQTCSKQVRSSEELLAVDASRIISYLESPDGRPPWPEEYERRFEDQVERAQPARDDGGGVTTASSYAPPYYALVAPAYGAASASGGSVFERLAAMRLVSALLAGLTAALAALVVLELLPGRRFAAAVAGLLVGFQPMFAFIGGALNNDNGVNTAVALLVYLLVRALRRGLTPALAAGIAATLAVAPLFKLTGYAAYPPALLAFGFLLWRQHRRADLPAWAALVGTFVAVEVAWSLLSSTFDRNLYATPDGGAPGSQPTVSGARSDPLGYLSYLWQVFLPKLPFMADLHVQKWPAYDIYVERGFGAFGWYAIKFPTWVYLSIVAAVGAVAALAVRAVSLESGAVRKRLPQLLVMLALAATVILGVHASFFSTTGDRPVVAEQGRYAFPAITVFASIAVAACYGLGRRRAVLLGTALVTGMLGLGIAGQLLSLGRFFS